MTSSIADYYTVEELEAQSGFRASTIYDFTTFGILTPPVRGADPTLYPSKGLYPAEVLDQLRRYRELKMSGMRKSVILEIMRAELTARSSADVQVRQG